MNKLTSEIYVIKVIDEYTVVINKGSKDGLKQNQRFMIYSIDDEPLVDPITKENLGYLELVKGIAKVKHLQESVSTLESASYSKPTRTVRKQRNPIITLGTSTTEEILSDEEQLPFQDIQVKDYVKII